VGTDEVRDGVELTNLDQPLSGAGPSVLAFTRTSAEVDAANAALPKGWWGSPLAVDLVGAHLVSTQR